jgi:hypothetical protein
MPSTAHGADEQGLAGSSRSPIADCAYLHSAFGPGCPYCDETADPVGAIDPAGSSTPRRPDHDLDLGAVA